ELLRGRRAELDRDPDRRGHRPGDRALDKRGAARHRRDGPEHRPAAPLPGQTGGPPDPDGRVAGHGVRDPPPGPAAPDRARRGGAKVSPVHGRLVAQRAYFRDVSGWEGADWYAPEGTVPEGAAPQAGQLSWGRQDWFGYWEAEHHATRTGVILMDMAFMAKFHVQGNDAGRVLEQVSANHVDGEPGRITYTQWLNPGGTLEADLTVTKLADDRFWVVASDTA